MTKRKRIFIFVAQIIYRWSLLSNRMFDMTGISSLNIKVNGLETTLLMADSLISSCSQRFQHF